MLIGCCGSISVILIILIKYIVKIYLTSIIYITDMLPQHPINIRELINEHF